MNRVLLTELNAATMEQGYGLIRDAAILVENGRIAWVGPRADAPEAERTRAMNGCLVTPALIDCHSHIVFGGTRAGEFEMRLEGASYQEVARAGGGIVSTVRDTRAASEAELLAGALKRVDAMIAEGVGVIEVKSGYGLNIEAEMRMLRVARRIAAERPVHIRTTWLAAHALPPEYEGRADAYIDEVCVKGLRAAHA